MHFAITLTPASTEAKMFTKINRWVLLIVLLAAGLAVPAGRPALAFHEEDHLHVLIDIKPGEFPNTINIKSMGKITVALFGSAEFDVSRVDLSTVMLSPMGEHEVGAPAVRYTYADVNQDGYMDILFKFLTNRTGFTPADTEACLHGMTTDGVHFCGHDSIVVIR
jgi:hypothetical protein